AHRTAMPRPREALSGRDLDPCARAPGLRATPVILPGCLAPACRTRHADRGRAISLLPYALAQGPRSAPYGGGRNVQVVGPSPRLRDDPGLPAVPWPFGLFA